MGNRKKLKLLAMLFLVLLLSIGVCESTFAYGGGGGGGGSGSDPFFDGPPKKTETVREYTREELEEFFSGLPDNVRDMVIDKQEGKPRTPAQLNLIRNIFLDAEKFQHESEEAIWQSYEEIAVVLDQAGQNAELVLTFVTGGTSNIVTGTLFGATRAAINAANEGKSTEDILQAIAVTVAVDNIMKIKGLDKIGTRGGELVDMVYRANNLAKNPKVVSYLARVATKAGIVKAGEKYTKDQIGAILNYMANTAKKHEVKTTKKPTDIYRNQAGFW